MRILITDAEASAKRSYQYALSKKYYRHISIGLVSGILNGLFGSGGGCIVVPAMEKFLKMDEKKSHATAIAVILVMSAVSSFSISAADILIIKYGFPLPSAE